MIKGFDFNCNPFSAMGVHTPAKGAVTSWLVGQPTTAAVVPVTNPPHFNIGFDIAGGDATQIGDVARTRIDGVYDANYNVTFDGSPTKDVTGTTLTAAAHTADVAIFRAGVQVSAYSSVANFTVPSGVTFVAPALVDHALSNNIESTTTFSAMAAGTADPNRILIAAIGFRENVGGETIASVTIGGIAATKVTGSEIGSVGFSGASMWYASVPSGTTADVVITSVVNTVRRGCGLYRMVTLTPTPTAGYSDVNLSNANLSAAVTVPSGGGGVAHMFNRTDTAGATVTGCTLDYQATIGSSALFAGAHISATGTVTMTGIQDAEGQAMCVGVWGP